jgi:hypothetical protein
MTFDLRSSGMLRSAEWYPFTDVSGQRVDSIFKDKEVQEEKDLDFLTF